MRLKYYIFSFIFLVSFYTHSETIRCQDLNLSVEAIFDSKILNDDLTNYSSKQKLFYDYTRVANEKNIYHFFNYMKKGGALVGLGGDQLYTFAGISRSEGLWLYDLDSRVIAIHHLMRISFLNSKNTSEFIKLFTKLEDVSRTEENKVFLKTYFTDSQFVQFLLDLSINSKLSLHFKKLANQQDPSGQQSTFLSNTEAYVHMRKLALDDKIKIFFGNHLDSEFMSLIDLSLRTNNLQVANLYISNSNELRWLVPNEFGFFISLSMGADRHDLDALLDQLSQLSQKVSEPEANHNLASKSILEKEINQTLNSIQLKLAIIRGAAENLNKLINNFKMLPYSHGAQILTTSIDVFNILKIQPIFSIREEESFDGMEFQWTYASLEASAFINNNLSIYQATSERLIKLNQILSRDKKP